MCADLVRTVEIIFGAVDRDTKSVLGGIERSFDSFSSGIQNVAKPVTEVTDAMLKAEVAVATLAAAFLAASTGASSKFGEKIEEIGSLVNATPEKVNALGNSIQQFAVNSTSDFDKITAAIYIATSNLGDTSRAMDILGVAEKGAIVGATDLEATTALLTRTMNAYGLVTDDSATNTANAERVMAAMFTTVQGGDVNMTALSENLGKVASTAAAAGVPIETVGAAIAAITGAGIGADQSMTLLNSLLKELLGPSESLSAALGGMTVATSGLPAILEKIKTATGGSADKMFEMFASTEAAKGALILANDSAGKFHTTLAAMDSGVENFNKNFDDFAGGMADSLQKLENSWLSMMITVGKPNQENFQGVYDSFALVLQAIEASMRGGAFDFVYKYLDDFSDNLSESLIAIAKNMPEAFKGVDFSALLDELNNLSGEFKDAFGDIFGDIDITTVEGLHNAIQTAVNIITNLLKVTRGIVAEFEPIFKLIGEMGLAISKTNGDTADAAGKLLGALKLLSDFGTMFGGILIALHEFQVDIHGTFEVVAGGTKIFVNAFQVAFDVTVAAFYEFLQKLYEGKAAISEFFGLEKESENFQTRANEYKKTAEGLHDSLLKNADEMKSGWAQMTGDVSDESEKASGSIKKIGEAAEAPKDAFAQLGVSSGILIDSFEQFGYVLDPVSGQLEKVAQTSGRTTEEIDKILKSVYDATDATDVLSKSFKTLEEAEKFATESTDKFNQIQIRQVDGLYEVSGQAIKTGQAQEFLADATEKVEKSAAKGSEEWKRAQDVLIESEKVANDFKIKLGELALARYEIDVKANVDLRVAEIEADTARIQSVMEATAETVSSLSDAAVGLWEAFAGQGDRITQHHLEDAAKRMEDRLDEELAIKRDIAEVLVEKMRAEATRLSSGEPLISIDGGTLAPELEMIFDKILKYTQIKMTEQGLSMLVGL